MQKAWMQAWGFRSTVRVTLTVLLLDAGFRVAYGRAIPCVGLLLAPCKLMRVLRTCTGCWPYLLQAEEMHDILIKDYPGMGDINKVLTKRAEAGASEDFKLLVVDGQRPDEHVTGVRGNGWDMCLALATDLRPLHSNIQLLATQRAFFPRRPR